jgi:hypothetical protein
VRSAASRRAISPGAAWDSTRSTSTSRSLHARVSVSTTQNVPSTWPSGEWIGNPAQAATPMLSTDGLSRVRVSVRASSTTSGSAVPTTYWQKDSSTALPRLAGSLKVPGSTPMQLFQNERVSSTTVTKASGASSSVAASPVSRSKGSSGGEPSRPVARTAASRAGS